MSRKFKIHIRASTGHTLYVASISREELPANLEASASEYKKFYVVRNWDEEGKVFFYLGKGYSLAPNQIVGWYPVSGSFWSSYGLNLEEAVEGMIKDGWLYA